MKNLSIIALLLSHLIFSQTKDIEFGKISREEIEMMSYEQDEEAKAVILYDRGKSIFFDTFTKIEGSKFSLLENIL